MATSSIFATNVNTVMQSIKDLSFGETDVNREHLHEYLQSQVVYIRY